jgi:hypothetical protein
VLKQFLGPLKLIDLKRIVEEEGADKNTKIFDTYSHLVTMSFSQIAETTSLREVENGLDLARGELNHLGLRQAPSRSTLAYANEHRSWKVFERIFYELLNVLSNELTQSGSFVKPPIKFKLKSKVYSIDSTTVDLCHSVYDWADFRRTKGGIKVHVLLLQGHYLPVWVHITNAKKHDQKVIESLDPIRGLPRGSFVVGDRAYNDYFMINGWDEAGINFVLRAKSNMSYYVVRELEVPNKVGRPPSADKAEATKDQDSVPHVVSVKAIKFRSNKSAADYPKELRLIKFSAPQKRLNGKPKVYEFITNNFSLSPFTIAQLYKSRWEIESFFRLLKQNLNVKTFLGTSANAVKTQVYVSMITFLLLEYLMALSRRGWIKNISALQSIVRLSLLQHIDLHKWLTRSLVDAPPGIDPRDGARFLF